MSYCRAHSSVRRPLAGGFWDELWDQGIRVFTPIQDPVALRGKLGVSTGSGVVLPTATTSSSPLPQPGQPGGPPAPGAEPFYKNPLVIAVAIVGAAVLWNRRRR